MNYKKLIGYIMFSVPFVGIATLISVFSELWMGIAIVGGAALIALIVIVGISLIEDD